MSKRHLALIFSDIETKFDFFPLVWNSLRVDPEPKRSGMTKTLRVEGSDLIVDFECKETRTMRVSVNSFFDLLSLVVDTIDQFAI